MKLIMHANTIGIEHLHFVLIEKGLIEKIGNKYSITLNGQAKIDKAKAHEITYWNSWKKLEK